MKTRKGSNLNIHRSSIRRLRSLAAVYAAMLAIAPCSAIEIPEEVLEAEARRVEVVAKVSEPTVAVFDPAGEGGGSGVLISADGFALLLGTVLWLGATWAHGALGGQPAGVWAFLG